MKILLVLAALTGAAQAQSRTFYDASGRNVGTAATDSQGAVTYRDNNGRVTGRTLTDSQGTTTLYDASGRNVGKATGGKR